MQEGQRIAIPRLFPEPTNPTNMSDDQLLLLGHLVGDGSYLSGQPLRYTTASEANSEAVTAAAKREFDMIVNRHEAPKEMNWHQLVFSGNGNRWQPKGMNKWLRDLGIFNQRSCEKQLPPIVFNLPNSKIALLLQHLWATDGTLFTPTTPNSSTRIAFSTNSWNLANDVAYLLLRFGIVARIRTTKQGENKEGKQYRDMYSVEVSGGDNQLHFLDSIGAFGDKKAQAKALYEYITTKKANTNIDTVPIEIFGYIKDKMQERGISQRQMAAKRGTSYGGSGHFSYAPSRKVLQSYADLLEDEYLENTSNSAIFWDTIKTIEPIGEEMVYDLTVPNYASWVANGIFSHNSGAIEQDADIVSFIYRPEYYKIDEDEEGNSTKGIGEIIIAKHRNGALEDVKLRFKAEFAKFENLDEAEYGFSVFDTFNPIEPPVSNIITRGSKLNNTPPPPAFGEDEVPF